MLKAEQIPDAVACLADEAYYDIAGENPTMSDEDIMKHAIAAALNAWPWMQAILNYFQQTEEIILPLSPLPQEASDE